MVERVETAVIGGGQAGLAMSHHLTALGRDHVVLERGGVGDGWRSRWDSFCLVTPNWSVHLPGFDYDGTDPDGFMSRDEVVSHVEQYADRVKPPIRLGTNVTALRKKATGDAYLLDTTDGALEARNVVVATGPFQKPKIPVVAAELPVGIQQIHSDEYLNPRQLPPGAVLVVGTGQSGAQIAEELYQSGRRVFLSVGRCGRGPRRYRGRDGMWWMVRMGMLDQTVDQLPPEARVRCNLHVSGRDGGHDLNLRTFAQEEVTLLGHFEDAFDGRIRLASDLQENLAKADEAAARMMKGIDEFVRRTGIDAPDEDPGEEFHPDEGADGAPILELDLTSEGISTVVWATGYRLDYPWIHLPVVGEDGLPVHRRGVTPFPGLYFLGLHLLYKPKSALLYGVGEDAAFLASHIHARDG